MSVPCQAEAGIPHAELLRLPDLPRLDLPEEGSAVRRGRAGMTRPCPKISSARDDRRWMSDQAQNWLVGDLSFEYDGHVVSAPEPGPERLRSPTSDGCSGADPGGRAVLRDQARRGRLPSQDRNTARARPWSSCKHATCRKPRRALLQEGWRVEAQGKLYRQAGDFRIEVTSGIDWFELHGGASFDGQEIPLPTLLAALRRGEDLVTLGDGSFGLLPEEWLKEVRDPGRGAERRRGITFGSGGRKSACSTSCWPSSPGCDSTRGSSGRASGCASSRASPPRTRRPGSGVSSAAISATASAGSISSGSSVSAAAWPTTWAWVRPFKCSPCWKRAASCGPPARRPPTPAVAGRGATVALRLQLDTGGRTRFAPKLRVLDHTGIGRE